MPIPKSSALNATHLHISIWTPECSTTHSISPRWKRNIKINTHYKTLRSTHSKHNAEIAARSIKIDVKGTARLVRRTHTHTYIVANCTTHKLRKPTRRPLGELWYDCKLIFASAPIASNEADCLIASESMTDWLTDWRSGRLLQKLVATEYVFDSARKRVVIYLVAPK